MSDVLCPLHGHSIVGYSVVHRCLYCDECEDCVGDEGNIRVSDMADKDAVMTDDIVIDIIKSKRPVNEHIKSYHIVLKQIDDIMAEPSEQMKDPERLYRETKAQLLSMTGICGAMRRNCLHTVGRVEREVSQIIDVDDQIREELDGLEKWIEQAEEFRADLERRVKREKHILSLLSELSKYDEGDVVDDHGMVLVLHVVIETDWLRRGVELPVALRRPKTPELPVFGRLRECMEENKRLSDRVESLESSLQTQIKEKDVEIERVREEYQSRFEALEKQLKEQSRILKQISIPDDLSSLTKRIMVMRKEGRVVSKDLLDRRMKLIPSVGRTKIVYDMRDFVSFPGVEKIEWVKKIRGNHMKDVWGFRCSEPMKIDELTEGGVQSVALSQFGVLMIFEFNRKELHFHDLVNDSRFMIGGFENNTYVSWYKSDVVTLTECEFIIRRASYMNLLEKPDISTFNSFTVPWCDRCGDCQLSQYTGKIAYGSGGKLVIFDVEMMKPEMPGIEMSYHVNTGCVVPDGTMGLMSTDSESFFLDEDGKVKGMRFRFGDWEAILSSSDPFDLDKALLRGVYSDWHIPRRKEPVKGDDFREQTGWNGFCFVRLINDVFLFYGDKKEGDRWIYGWYVIRMSVP